MFKEQVGNRQQRTKGNQENYSWTNSFGTTGFPNAKEKISLPHIIKKVNLKWMNNIDVRSKTVKLLDKTWGSVFMNWI